MNGINTLIELKTYDDGWKEPTVLVGVNSHEEGLTINLPAQMTDANPKNFGANVYIERRADGFAIVLSPGDGESAQSIVYMRDNGTMTIDDEKRNVVLDYTPPEGWDAVDDSTKARLEYLRGELRAERISYAELLELESLIPYIAAGDVELLEAAGVPEFFKSP